MINLGKRTGFGFLFLILVLYTNQIFGQISSAALLLVDTAGLGDPISVDIKIVFPLNLDIKTIDFSDYKRILNKAYTQDSMTMEEYADLEVLDFGEWKYEALDIPVGVDKLKFTLENGKNVIFNTIKIAIYNIGVFAVPAPKVILGDTSVSIIHGQSSVIQITLPEKLMKQDTVVFNPIKDIIREDANFSDYLNYVYLLLGLLLIAGIGYYFYRLKKLKNKLVVANIEIMIPCHEKALTALRQLEEKELWQQGMIKEYQSGLTDIVRTYLQERYNIDAPEMTTDEIISALKKANFDRKYSYELVNILQIADLVKFAKARPEENIHANFMLMAVEFIENTKEVPSVAKVL